MVIRSSVDNILIATNGTNGQPGTPGTSSYIHIKYSNDGGQTFTANDGETIGAYIGIYKDYAEADSSNVADYQWKKIEGEDGEPAYTIMLSNENFSISTDTSYVPIHTQNYSCNVTMLKGGSPADFTITASTDTENDIVTTVNGHTVTIAVAPVEALSAPQGVITLTITTIDGQDTHTFTKDITWSVATQGRDGQSGSAGDKGDTGRGIASITEYFLLSDTDDASKITFPEQNDKHGWTTVGEALIWSKAKPVLWHCTEVVYENSDGTRDYEYIDKYPDTGWKAADLVQSNLTDFQQGVDNVIDRDNQSIRSAVWENTYTYKPKTDSQGNYIYDEHGKIVPDTDNTRTMSEYMAETIVDMNGITSRVASTESDIDGIDDRVTQAESTITQHATDIEAKVSKDGVIAAINLSTETEGGSTAKISADKVEINGTAIFNSIKDDVDDAINTATADMATNSSIANTYATKTNAINRQQRIYYRKTTSGAPSKNTTWLTESGTGYGNWSLSIPPLTSGDTKYPYLYTAVQTQTVAQQASGATSNNCSCSDVLIDDTATVIDGGTIITGTVTAREITTDNLQGDHGWINLKDGKFYYGDNSTFANATNAISWNGTKLQIKADDFLLSSGKTIFDEIEAIETWFYPTAPTITNEPASLWTTDNLKEMHLRDIYFDTTSGKSYRWAIDDNVYKWVEIEDEELSAVAGRLATAETNIQTNSQAITERATKVEIANTYETKEDAASKLSEAKQDAKDKADVAESNAKQDTTTKLKSYYTKTETDAEIEKTAKGITTRVTEVETRTVGNYAISSTNAGESAKIATIIPTVEDWKLYNGAVINVKFTNANTSSSPTLNINGTGALNIKNYSGDNLSEAEYKWDAGSTMSFVYDGTNWRIQDSTELTNIKKNQTQIEQTATSITSLADGGDTYTKPDGTTGTNTLKSMIDQTANSITSLVEGNGTYTTPDGTTAENKLTTLISQNTNQITLKANSSDVYTKTETNGLIDDTKQYADDAVESFSSQFTLTPSEISSEVTALQNGSEISSRINQTANDVKIKASKVEIDGAAIFNNSDFREAADEAYDAKGTAEEVISNLEIGGRNLLLDTNTSSLNKVSSNVDRYWSNAETLSDDGNAEFVEITDSPTNGIRYGIQLSSTGNGANSHALAFYKASLADRFRFEVGQTYTLSCYVKHISGSDSDVFINIGSRTAMGIWDYATFTLSSESDSWMKVAWTFKPTFSSNGRSIDGSDDGVGNVVIAKTEEVYSTDDDNGNVTIYTIIANDDGEGNVVILKEASDEDPSDDSRIIYFGMDYSSECTIQMCGFKLEKGNFATDWTPAPEDVETYTNSAINTLSQHVSETYATQAEAVNRSHRIYFRSDESNRPTAPTEWVVDSSNLDEDVYNAWTTRIPKYATEDGTRYPYLYTCEQREYVSGETPICTTVLLDDSITVINGGNIITHSITTDQIDTIDINASGILRVGAFNAEDQDDILNSHLKVGGRNYIINTDNIDVSEASKLPRIIEQPVDTITSDGSITSATHGFRITNTEANIRPYITFGSNDISTANMNGLEEGNIYTISFDCNYSVISNVTSDEESDSISYMCVWLGYLTYEYDSETEAPAEFEEILIQQFSPVQYGTEGATSRCEATFTLPDNTTMFYLTIACDDLTAEDYGASDYIELSNIKLEEGNKATTWTPALEDISEQFTDVNNLLTTTRKDLGDFEGDVKGWLTFDDELIIGKRDADGNISPFTTVIDNKSLSFNQDGTPVAYINTQTLYITDAEIKNNLYIGKYLFKPHDTDHGMSLVWDELRGDE